MQIFTIPKCLLLLFPILFYSCAPNSNQEPQPVYEIENTEINKAFLMHPSSKSPIYLRISDVNHTHVAKSTAEYPYFAFVINHTLISSSDSIWEFSGATKRDMGNNGVEHILTFKVNQEEFKGLTVKVYQQIFEDGTLVREKIRLQTDSNTSFSLNKKQDTLYFRFPQYVLSKGGAKATTKEIRIASWNLKPVTFAKDTDATGKSNHMYYPRVITKPVNNLPDPVKGPFLITQTGSSTFGMAYEHASQDNTSGMLNEKKVPEDGRIVDAMQGTKGVFDFELKDSDFKFLGLSAYMQDSVLIARMDALRGVYLDGQEINAENPFETVWTTHFFHAGNDTTTRDIIHDYLLNKICEKPASRKPEFYYNTWGMQRASEELRDVLNYENIFKEIDYAAQLGVDIFVLDDGWQENFGLWKPHPKRLPEGLKPIKEKLDEHGMTLGIWLSPPTIDSTTQRYKDHPEWVIKDSRGNPIQAQWGHCAFDMVSDYQQLFIEDCKWLIDQGARFFKWDAINTFFSTQPGLHHGTANYSPEERRARYEYLLPLYITEAMEVLTDYEPELVIEVDLTEARRVMNGLAPLSQGKLFWMNNGASGYNDYGPYRTQSMRTIPNEFAGIIPLELFTYANYPHTIGGVQDYNMNTSLISGHGFWGRLNLMTENERLHVKDKVMISKKILPYLVEVIPDVQGKVGDSPEIYAQVNKQAAAGQIIGFTTHPVGDVEYQAAINPDSFNVLLHAPYELEDSLLTVNLNLDKAYSTRAAFILPLQGAEFHISKSSSAIYDFTHSSSQLSYKTSRGRQQIVFKGIDAIPDVEEDKNIVVHIHEKEGNTIINVEITDSATVHIDY